MSKLPKVDIDIILYISLVNRLFVGRCNKVWEIEQTDSFVQIAATVFRSGRFVCVPQQREKVDRENSREKTTASPENLTQQKAHNY